jgi:protein phosphatase PTC7
LAVCDGVGGWADHGVDPGLYSKELTRHISTLYKGSPESYSQIPKNLIIEAHKLTKAEGSTTCCILSLLKDKPLIKASYIGDSGYMIMRKND